MSETLGGDASDGTEVLRVRREGAAGGYDMSDQETALDVIAIQVPATARSGAKVTVNYNVQTCPMSSDVPQQIKAQRFRCT